MKRELLKEFGIADEAIDKIMEENGKDIEKVKGDAAQKTQELEAAAAKIAQLSDTVKKFDGVDVDDLRGQIGTLRQQYDADTAKLRLDHALETALLQGGARNPKTVLPLLDTSIIKLDGGKLCGLDEQMGKLKNDAEYLFSPSPPAGPTVNVGMPHGAPPSVDPLASFVTSARTAAGLGAN